MRVACKRDPAVPTILAVQLGMETIPARSLPVAALVRQAVLPAQPEREQEQLLDQIPPQEGREERAVPPGRPVVRVAPEPVWGRVLG